MFTTDLVSLYNRNIFKTSLYIYIFQDEKCRLLRNLSFIYVHDTPWKDGNVRFTNEPLITLSDQVWIRIDIKVFFESLIYICITLLKWLAHFLFNRSNGEAQTETLLPQENYCIFYILNHGLRFQAVPRIRTGNK